MGTVTDITELPNELEGYRQIWCNWDNGSILAMLEGLDKYEVIG